MVKHNVTDMEDGGILITTNNIFGEPAKHFIPCSLQKYNQAMDKYKSGALLQEAFSFLSLDDREFLLTGITPERWDMLYKEE